jgi:hypothetical protein
LLHPTNGRDLCVCSTHVEDHPGADLGLSLRAGWSRGVVVWLLPDLMLGVFSHRGNVVFFFYVRRGVGGGWRPTSAPHLLCIAPATTTPAPTSPCGRGAVWPLDQHTLPVAPCRSTERSPLNSTRCTRWREAREADELCAGGGSGAAAAGPPRGASGAGESADSTRDGTPCSHRTASTTSSASSWRRLEALASKQAATSVPRRLCGSVYNLRGLSSSPL